MLIDGLNGQRLTGHIPGADLYDQLRRQLDALPLDLNQTCFFRNTITDSQTLATSNDMFIARWQMVQVVRRLRAIPRCLER